MTFAEVRSIVLEVLAEVQTAISDAPIPVTDATRPIGEIPMFDSILSEDTTVTLLQRLGVTANDAPNPFIVAGQAARVGQVVQALSALVGATEA